METKPDNAIDFKDVSFEEAQAAGSPAEQPKMSEAEADRVYATQVPSMPNQEDVARAQEVLQTLQNAPDTKVGIPQEKAETIPNGDHRMSPSDFMEKWGGEAILKGYATAPSEQGAADFLKSNRLTTGEKLGILGIPAVGITLGALTASLGGFSGASALLAAGPAAVVIGGAVPVACVGVGAWFAYKGIRNIVAERSYRKTFGRSV